MVGVLSSWGGGGGFEEDCEGSDDNGLAPLPDRPPGCSLSLILADIINVSGYRLSTTEIESALIMHKETTVIGTTDELTGEFAYDADNEAVLAKELVLQVLKVIGPFAAPKKIDVVPDLPKTPSVSLALPSFAHSYISLPFTFFAPHLRGGGSKRMLASLH
ncbi:hypothetical protein B0H13DRAFT_2356865 [Mycena leptocephala]|nr:hypothetical protein B0H13DRAFT_2356865 [Mycena leptocephala]